MFITLAWQAESLLDLGWWQPGSLPRSWQCCYAACPRAMAQVGYIPKFSLYISYTNLKLVALNGMGIPLRTTSTLVGKELDKTYHHNQ